MVANLTRPASLAFAVFMACAALSRLAAGGEGDSGQGPKPAAAEAAGPKQPEREPVAVPQPQVPPAPYGPGSVIILPLNDEVPGGAISGWNVAYIGRCLERARSEKAGLLLIELTTNGGELNTVMRMAEELSEARGVHTAVLVKGRAFSAGALVALACDDIYMQPGSVIGAATPIAVTPGGGGVEQLPSKVEEKFIRATVGKFEATAQRKGHSAALAAAMVDPDLEVLAVRTGKSEKLELLNREQYEKAVAGPQGRQVQLVEVVKPKGKLLVMSAEDAVKWGLARGMHNDRAEALAGAGLAARPVEILEATLSDRLGRFFSSAIVVSLLIAAAVLALYVELNHPSGVAAGFFLLALGLFFWANYMAGTAGAVSIILVLAGAVFLLVEIFFFPGFGVPGIVGVVLVVAGLVAARIPKGLGGGGGGVTPPEVRWEILSAAVAPVFVGLGLGAVGIAVLMRYFPRLPLLNRLVLTSDLGGAVVTAAQGAGLERPEQLVGRSGVAATNLRPGGSARFDGKLLDVISDSEWLEAGTAVKIVSADSNRIIVRRA